MSWQCYIVSYFCCVYRTIEYINETNLLIKADSSKLMLPSMYSTQVPPPFTTLTLLLTAAADTYYHYCTVYTTLLPYPFYLPTTHTVQQYVCALGCAAPIILHYTSLLCPLLLPLARPTRTERYTTTRQNRLNTQSSALRTVIALLPPQRCHYNLMPVDISTR